MTPELALTLGLIAVALASGAIGWVARGYFARPALGGATTGPRGDWSPAPHGWDSHEDVDELNACTRMHYPPPLTLPERAPDPVTTIPVRGSGWESEQDWVNRQRLAQSRGRAAVPADGRGLLLIPEGALTASGELAPKVAVEFDDGCVGEHSPSSRPWQCVMAPAGGSPDRA